MWSQLIKSFYIKSIHKHLQQYVWSPGAFFPPHLASSELPHALLSLGSSCYMILHLKLQFDEPQKQNKTKPTKQTKKKTQNAI